jgi:hypothetical protein
MKALIAALSLLALAACEDGKPEANRTQIKVRGPEQDALHGLDALNLAIALKRAIYAAGYTCKRVTDAGFVAEYENLDMWMARCVYDNRSTVDWAIFAGADGTAQVRDCKDVDVSAGLPKCEIKKRPKGSFG